MNDETKAELLRSLGAKGVGDVDVLAATMRAVLTDEGAPLAQQEGRLIDPGEGEEATPVLTEPAPNLHHEAGDVIDLLDEAGWFFTQVPDEPEPHPASAEQRLAAFQAIPLQPLETIDQHARWLATGELERPEEQELREALDELEAIEVDDADLSATTAALHKVAGAARTLVGG